MSERRMFCVGLYLTKGGESAIVDQVLSLWSEGYILAGRRGAKRWIKCRWYPDGRYREEDLSSGLDPCDGDHLDLGVHLKTEIDSLTARLAAAEAERDVERKDSVAAEFEMLRLREDHTTESGDVVDDLRGVTESVDTGYCDKLVVRQAIVEIVKLRRCIRSVVDAYCLADKFSDGHKQVVLSDQWHVWAQTLILNRTLTAALGGKQ
jgi:hypothetical protein